MRMEIVCGARENCGFRVDDLYYTRKPQFQKGTCARCGGPIAYVEQGTEVLVPNLAMGPDGRAVVPERME